MRFERREGIGIIWFPSLSEISPLLETRDRFADLCSEIESDEEIRVVIITAEDRRGRGTGLMEELLPLLHLHPQRLRFTDPIRSLDRPCICAIPGDARGIGLEIALACDIRVASEDSRFSIPHVEQGLVPWDGATQLLPRLVGLGNALELLLMGKVVDAKEARRIGLVSAIFPRSSLMAETERMAKEIASKAPVALRFIREAVHKGLDMTLEQGLRMEGDLYLLLFTTADRREGIQAFREKRKAHFRGR